MSGTAAGTDLLVVRDGATGTGAIIWQSDLVIPDNGTAVIALTGLDLRASVGNALTVEFVAGLASARECISVQGDFVPRGYPLAASMRL